MGYRFLIVDDSATMRALIKRTLTLTGLPIDAISESDNGRSAMVTLIGGQFDLVFIDLNMPELSGTEMVARMRANPKLANVPVMIVSSEAMDWRVEELKQAGVQGYVKKPFTPEQLRDAVNLILEIADAA